MTNSIYGFIIAFLLSFSLYSQTDSNTIESSLKFSIDSAGFPVVFKSDTVFNVHIGYGMLTPRKRAEYISRLLELISLEYNPHSDSIMLVYEGDLHLIKYKDEVLMEVNLLDAEFYKTSISSLSSVWYNSLRKTLNKSLSKEETILQYLTSIGIIIVVLFIINFILKRIFKRLNRFIASKRSKYIKGINIKDFEIMDSDDELELIYKLTMIMRLVLMLIIASTTFPVIFSLFPATEEVANQLIGFVIDPLTNFGLAVLNYIPNLFAIFIIVYVVRVILKYLKIASKRIEKGRLKIQGFYPEWSKTTYDVIKVLIIALSFVMLFPYLPGAQSDVFKGVSVFIGVIFSLGSTSIVGNLVAGLVLTYMRPFIIGDRIRIGEIEGEIVEKTAFVIRVKTPKNEYITIPNSNVQTSYITNFNRSIGEGGVILFTEITIGYNVPWRQVHELLLKAADQTPDLEKKPDPFVLQKELGDSSISYQINAFTKRPLYKDLISSLLHQNIQDIFNEAGIEILSAKYVASRDGSESTIPSKKEKRDSKENKDSNDKE